MRVVLEYWTDQIDPAHLDEVNEAVATLQKYVKQCNNGPSTPVVGAEVATAPVETETAETAEQTAARVKKEKAATAKVKRDAKKKAAGVAEVAKAAADPLAEVAVDATEVTGEQVREAVTAAITRLRTAGDAKPTQTIVDRLVELTGKKKVAQLDPSEFQTVLDDMDKLGV